MLAPAPCTWWHLSKGFLVWTEVVLWGFLIWRNHLVWHSDSKHNCNYHGTNFSLINAVWHGLTSSFIRVANLLAWSWLPTWAKNPVMLIGLSSFWVGSFCMFRQHNEGGSVDEDWRWCKRSQVFWKNNDVYPSRLGALSELLIYLVKLHILDH
jgi:hypothetical protein